MKVATLNRFLQTKLSYIEKMLSRAFIARENKSMSGFKEQADSIVRS